MPLLSEALPKWHRPSGARAGVPEAVSYNSYLEGFMCKMRSRKKTQCGHGCAVTRWGSTAHWQQLLYLRHMLDVRLENRTYAPRKHSSLERPLKDTAGERGPKRRRQGPRTSVFVTDGLMFP